MNSKVFKLKGEEIIRLIPQMGGCMATDRITVDGLQIGYMYREDSDLEKDSGWRFFSGLKTKIMLTIQPTL